MEHEPKLDRSDGGRGIDVGPLQRSVVLSIDPLLSGDQQESPQFMMELASTESGDVPKRFSLEMSKDFIPMSVFLKSTEGNIIENLSPCQVELQMLAKVKFDFLHMGKNKQSNEQDQRDTGDQEEASAETGRAEEDKGTAARWRRSCSSSNQTGL
ncbi:hypothetical protein MLD38_038096 [Melastoma candidum]|uniref:Uncharacterized protein n=1 Tax=Melastoma candidum TaxID=119954 RepID=A0ACB9KYH4_9MYRT|nr:hypothetical protein MLD38_038096 [Melastoma candidum]